MKSGLLLCCLGLAGCATVENFPILEVANTKEITLIRTPVTSQVCEMLSPAKPGRYVVACATVANGSCTIYVTPEATNDTWGHELRHCFDGRWHK